jgi:hypothetical protein
LKYADVATPSW